MKTSRRDFLNRTGCSLIGSTAIFNTLLNLRMAGNAAAAGAGGSSDYKALVCLFMRGGNDSYNMLVPTSPTEHAHYAASRSNVALPLTGAGAPLPLSVQNTPGRSFGLHSSMPALHSMFEDGKAAFIANMGTLVEPTTLAQYSADSVALPRSLFAHNEQQGHWQTSVPQGGELTGWGGRAADILMDQGVSPGLVSMNISLAGNNIFQSGDSTVQYSITADGSIRLVGGSATAGPAVVRSEEVNSLMDLQYKNTFEKVFAEMNKGGIENNEAFATAFESSSLTTNFPGDALGQNMEAIAKTIKSRSALGQCRQCFFVDIGGWDNHFELTETQATNLGLVDAAVSAFWQAIEGELGLANDVMLFSCSDFARTLRSNGQGTDHAWGGNQFVLGGDVNGGNIFGDYPSTLLLGQGQDVATNGRLLPTTSCDEYFAELCQWYGVQDTYLGDVFPNLGNFYSIGSGKPIGFTV